MLSTVTVALLLCAGVVSHEGHDQTPISGPHQGLWYNTFNKIPGDGGTQVGHDSNHEAMKPADRERRIPSSRASPPSDDFHTSPA